MSEARGLIQWLCVIAFAALPVHAQQVIAQDSNGVVVEVNEKYGGTVIDTCTVVMFTNDQFVLVKRNGTSAWFPASFHSVRVVEKLAPHDPLAAVIRDDE